MAGSLTHHEIGGIVVAATLFFLIGYGLINQYGSQIKKYLNW